MATRSPTLGVFVDAEPDLLDDPDPFVSGDKRGNRVAAGQLAVFRVDVGVAQACGLDLDEDHVRVRVRGRHQLRERGALLRVVEAAGEVDLQGSGQHALGNVHGLVVFRVGRAGCEGQHGGVPGRSGL